MPNVQSQKSNNQSPKSNNQSQKSNNQSPKSNSQSPTAKSQMPKANAKRNKHRTHTHQTLAGRCGAGALEQARNLANLPFAFRHIALMPDCHQGFGMPIGGVLATREVIIPNAVGVDIGCGMCAVQTSLHEVDRKSLKSLMAGIRELVPLGFKRHNKPQDPARMPELEFPEDMPVVSQEYESATYQVGSLGGGNHFIEVQKGSDGQVWIMVHSGSRNIGKQVADHYNRLAVQLNEQQRNPLPRSWQLAALLVESGPGRQYIREMNYCIEFAFANRRLMMDNILSVFSDHFGGEFRTAPMINIAHNYAAPETHFGQLVMVHRKGATKASRETTGIIPGSQGANSFIVRGKGNKESFESCSHGAGRVMGRKEAIRSLDLDEEIRKLEEKGIIHAIRSKGDLEEAASAYKDIAQVMKNQDDLVDILVELQPLAVIKG
jgi:tRNA-splicing ligase RtcB (3'-phosphate/5'-hydroxy nucleic acid ligase)